MLVDSKYVVALQETHGLMEDLKELLKLPQNCWMCSTFADSRNAG